MSNAFLIIVIGILLLYLSASGKLPAVLAVLKASPDQLNKIFK